MEEKTQWIYPDNILLNQNHSCLHPKSKERYKIVSNFNKWLTNFNKGLTNFNKWLTKFL